MFLSDLDKIGYPVGTFKIGQKIYRIKNKEYRFRFHKKCQYCDSTGSVLIKDKEFVCPACKGEYIHKGIIEKVVDDYDIKIRSVISLKNRDGSYESYSTDLSGHGLQIHKCDDSSKIYFGTEKEAQEACDKFNKEHNVDLYLEEYSRIALKESIRNNL